MDKDSRYHYVRRLLYEWETWGSYFIIFIASTVLPPFNSRAASPAAEAHEVRSRAVLSGGHGSEHEAVGPIPQPEVHRTGNGNGLIPTAPTEARTRALLPDHSITLKS